MARCINDVDVITVPVDDIAGQRDAFQQLRDQAAKGGLRFEAYLPPSLAPY